MQASFGIAREKQNHLYYKEYENDKGSFHFHSQIELYFIDEGEMEVTVNNQRRLLEEGQMSVSLSYDAHAYRTPSSSRSSVFIIPAHVCKDFLDLVKDKRALFPFILDPSVVAIIKEYVLKTRDPDINSITLSGFVRVVLGLVLDNLSFENRSPLKDTDLASRILFYVDKNYKNNVSLSDLASHFGYSQSFISRYFKNNFHIGFSRYLNLLRLKNALQLLNENEYSITFCALESGFSSLRTFYRVFDEQLGCSPKEFIRKRTENI